MFERRYYSDKVVSNCEKGINFLTKNNVTVVLQSNWLKNQIKILIKHSIS